MKFLLPITLAASLSAGVASAATLYSIDNPNGFRNDSWSFGEIFTVGLSDLTVYSLGAFDHLLDGFTTAGGIQVGLYRESDSALLASTNVLSSDTLIGNFRFQSISSIVLNAGEQYRVVGVNESDLYNLSSGIFNSGVTFDGYGYCNTSVLTSCDDFTGTGTNWMANLGFTPISPVPLPASSLLLMAGLGGLAAMRRRKPAV